MVLLLCVWTVPSRHVTCLPTSKVGLVPVVVGAVGRHSVTFYLAVLRHTLWRLSESLALLEIEGKLLEAWQQGCALMGLAVSARVLSEQVKVQATSPLVLRSSRPNPHCTRVVVVRHSVQRGVILVRIENPVRRREKLRGLKNHLDHMLVAMEPRCFCRIMGQVKNVHGSRCSITPECQPGTIREIRPLPGSPLLAASWLAESCTRGRC